MNSTDSGLSTDKQERNAMDRNMPKAPMRDGISHAVMLGAGETYIGPFGIFLQATTIQIGLLATLPLVFEAASQWISALTLDRYRSRRKVILIWASIQAILWLPVAILPFLPLPSPLLVTVLICMATMSHVASGFIHPVWSSLVGDLVFISARGRFFGQRNRLTGMSSFISLLAAGGILHLSKSVGLAAAGFLMIFLVAMFARINSVRWIRHYDDPDYYMPPEHAFSFWQFLRRAPKSNFAKFVFFFAAMNFCVSFASPYFALYMLRDLQFSYLQFTSVSAVAIMCQFLTFRYWGEISDRFGNKKILNICSYGVGIIPICWLFSESLPFICSIQILGGIVWAGFNLASANFIYDACSPPKRARCVAYRGVINSIFVLLGSLAGGFTASHLPNIIEIGPVTLAHSLVVVFVISGVLRLLTATLLLKKFHEVREVENIRSRDLVFRVSHIKPIAGATFNLITYFFRDQREEKGKKEMDTEKQEG